MSTQPPRRLLVPRPRPQADRFAEAVEAAMPGAWTVVVAPLMEIRPTGAPVDLEDVNLLVFTSRNGVHVFAERYADRSKPVACVGEQTTKLARDLGFDATCRGATVQELGEELSLMEPRTILHLHGTHAAGDLPGVLAKAGHELREAVIYEQADCPLDEEVRAALAAGDIGAVTLFSPRMAARLGEETRGRGLAGDCHLLCLSQAVAAQAKRFHAGPITVCASPDARAMLSALQAISG